MLEKSFHVVNVILVIGQIHTYKLDLTSSKLYLLSRVKVVTIFLGLIEVYFALMEIWQHEYLLAEVTVSSVLFVTNVDQSMIIIIIQGHVIVN